MYDLQISILCNITRLILKLYVNILHSITTITNYFKIRKLILKRYIYLKNCWECCVLSMRLNHLSSLIICMLKKERVPK